MTKPCIVRLLADLSVNYTASGDRLLQLLTAVTPQAPPCLASDCLPTCPHFPLLSTTTFSHLVKADPKLTVNHIGKASPKPLMFLLLSLPTAGFAGAYHTVGGWWSSRAHLSLPEKKLHPLLLNSLAPLLPPQNCVSV